MKVQPVAIYSAPRYPTRLEVLDDPDLLLRNQPAGWKKVPGIATALACFLTAEGTLLSSCKGPAPAHRASAQAAAELVQSPEDAGTPVRGAGDLVVAPLSKHGEGRGAFGCVAVNPPVFLSEDEAFTVIEQELAKHGVKLAKPTEDWEQVQINRGCKNRRICPPQPLRMRPDGEDKTKSIAIEFIGKQDHYSLMGHSGASIDSFNFFQAAEHLRSQLLAASNTPRTYVGVFYDPVAQGRARACEQQHMLDPFGKIDHEKLAECVNRNRDLLQKTAAATTREELRLQVADFAAWLKGQGVL